MSNSPTRRVTLSPTPGFVVKTTSQQAGIYTPKAVAPPPSGQNTLEPSVELRSTAVPVGFKIFLNVAWDENVPAPPRDAKESDVRRAMSGDDSAYFVPVVVSEGREVADKAGKASLVFDAIFNTGVKERVGKDKEFKTFITEIALERVEEKSGLILGREIATPNIKSKGALTPREVLIPAYWVPESASPPSSSSPLIQEISPPAPSPLPSSSSPTTSAKKPPTSILKSSTSTMKKDGATVPSSPSVAIPSDITTDATPTSKSVPKYNLSIENTAPGVRTAKITIEVPHLTIEHHSQTLLDVEPHRLILTFPESTPYSTLDVPLFRTKEGKPAEDVGVKDLEGVDAEWRVKEGTLVVLLGRVR